MNLGIKIAILATSYNFESKLLACYIFIVAGFFYAYTGTAVPLKISGSVPPCVSVMDPLLSKCKTAGQAGPCFYSSLHLIKQVMSYCENETLEKLSGSLGLSGSSAIKIYFKRNKVTASCRLNGYTYGSRGKTLGEAIELLISKMKD